MKPIIHTILTTMAHVGKSNPQYLCSKSINIVVSLLVALSSVTTVVKVVGMFELKSCGILETFPFYTTVSFPAVTTLIIFFLFYANTYDL
jgi:hypothetical protein